MARGNLRHTTSESLRTRNRKHRPVGYDRLWYMRFVIVDPFAEDAVKISVEQVLSQNTGIRIISIFVIFMTCVASPCDVAGCMSCSSIFCDLRLFLSSCIDSHNVRRFKYQTTFYPAYFSCALGFRNKICLCSAVWPHIFLRIFAAQFLHYFRVMSSECHFM